MKLSNTEKIVIGLTGLLLVGTTIYITRKIVLKKNVLKDVSKESTPSLINKIDSNTKPSEGTPISDEEKAYIKNLEVEYPYDYPKIIKSLEKSIRKMNIILSNTNVKNFNVSKALDLMNESTVNQVLIDEFLKYNAFNEKPIRYNKLTDEQKFKIIKSAYELISLSNDDNGKRTQLEKQKFN